ncbi:hypothetical protein IWQ60_005010 [Tieghemiomyces parasiticus]|uniref:Uncharacterized protein n=1 Tax=Tieghemiomyces parasiticus TaxID=78921 RepID=A0A9W8DYM3_9FUNG|nr:hypothetical protein IWQ60_005010 [Tieghemiomyces parasiticus]
MAARTQLADEPQPAPANATASQATPTEPAANDASTPLGQVAEAMQANLGGVQSTLGTLMQSLTQSFQRTLDMTSAMNDLMESYLQQNVQVNVKVGSTLAVADCERPTPVLTVTVINRSKITLPEVRLALVFEEHQCRPAAELNELSTSDERADQASA